MWRRQANRRTDVMAGLDTGQRRIEELLERHIARGDAESLDLVGPLVERAIATAGSEGADSVAYGLASYQLGVYLRLLDEREGATSPARATLAAAREAVAAVPVDHPQRAVVLCALGMSLRTTGLLTDRSSLALESVSVLRESLTVAPADGPHHARCLANLAVSLVWVERWQESPALVAEALRCAGDAVAAVEPDDPTRFRYLRILGTVQERAAEREADQRGYEKAEQAYRQAAELMPQGHPDRTVLARRLFAVRYELYRMTEDPAWLRSATATATERRTPDSPPDPILARDLAPAWWQLYDRSGSLSDLGRAVEAYRVAVEQATDLEPVSTALLVDRARCTALFRARADDPAHTDEEILAHRAAVTAGTEDPETRTSLQAGLALALEVRFGLRNDPQDLVEAIAALRASIAGTEEPSALRAGRWYTLGRLLGSLREATGNSLLHTDEVAADRSAAEECPTDHPMRHQVLYNFGCALGDQYFATRKQPILVEAIEVFLRALDVAPEADGEARRRAGTSALPLLELYRTKTGDTALLERELLLRQEFTAQPSEGTPVAQHADELFELARMLRTLREKDPSRDRVAAEVAAFRAALAATPTDHPAYPLRLSAGLSAALDAHYDLTADLALLREIVAVDLDAAAATPSDDPQLALRHHFAGLSLGRLRTATGAEERLSEEVAADRAALAGAPTGHPDRLLYLACLAVSLGLLAEQCDGTDARTERVAVLRELVAGTAEGAPELLPRLGELTRALWRLRQENGDQSLLVEEVVVDRAVLAASADQESRGQAWSTLGVSLCQLADLHRDPALAEEAVAAQRSALAALPAADTESGRQSRMSRLIVALDLLHELTGSAATAHEQVDACRELVRATPADHPDRTLRLETFTKALSACRNHGVDLDLLTEEVEVDRALARLAPPGHPDHAQRQSWLGDSLTAWHQEAGAQEFAAEAVAAHRAALTATDPDDALSPVRMVRLASALAALCDHTEDPGDLAEGVRWCATALPRCPEGDPLHFVCLHTFSRLERRLHQNTGAEGWLDSAVDHAEQALRAAPEEELAALAARAAVGLCRHLRFQHHGTAADLSLAEQALREVVHRLPGGDQSRPGTMSNLSNVLVDRYLQEGDTGILVEAVGLARTAALESGPTHPERAGFLLNVQGQLERLFLRTGEPALLDEAIGHGQAALAASAQGSVDWARCQHNLSKLLTERAERTGEHSDLLAAVAAARDAVDTVPSGHRDRPTHLAALGTALRRLATHDGQAGTRLEAVQQLRAAVLEAREGDPQRAVRQVSLGLALCELVQHDPDPAAPELVEAEEQFAAVAHGPEHHPALRLGGYQLLLERLLRRPERADEALAAAEAAVALLPQLAFGGLHLEDRRYRMRLVGALAAQAAQAAVAVGRAARAVELLEQTRGVLVADLLDSRAEDLARLRREAPALADRFAAVREEIERLDRPDADPLALGVVPDTAALAARRRDVQDAWQSLTEAVRAVPGFADFLRPSTTDRLAARLGPDPVVLLYAGPTRGDALILTGPPAGAVGGSVRQVPLLGLTDTVVAEQSRRLSRACRLAADADTGPRARLAAQGEVLEVLAWLWDHVAGPVLAALGHHTAPPEGRPWPLIRWCPVGAFVHLPVHAAGHHADLTAQYPARPHQPRAVLDRVCSSYTTTLRQLALIRSAPAARPGADPARTPPILIVAVPDPPHARPLATVADEVAAIRSLVPGALAPPRPDRAAVLAALPSAPIVHFACHGVSDPQRPAGSRLLLPDHETAPLTLAEIAALRLSGELAYLSACDTQVTPADLAEEAVHLSGAFQLAGFRQVVGTLWPVSDLAAERVARGFYGHLTEDGQRPPQPDRACLALHHAVRDLRARYPRTPTVWAAHTHTGA
jgi:tetratricopeptide (TPR) repeat protein